MGDTRCVLAIDIGNTTTRFGLFTLDVLGRAASSGVGKATALGGQAASSGGQSAASGLALRGNERADAVLLGSCELVTSVPLTVDEVRLQINNALTLLPEARIQAAILSCVVPSITHAWRQACQEVVPSRVLHVGPGLKTGMRMMYDDPGEVGPDRVANVVAAKTSYGSPVIVVDFGTTTNIEVLDTQGAFVGGIIAPGMALGAQALANAAARLPEVELRTPKKVIGRNTRSAMQSGIVLGEAARIDGLLSYILDELGYKAQVVLTGDGASVLSYLMKHDTVVDTTLTLRGLAYLWALNARSA